MKTLLVPVLALAALTGSGAAWTSHAQAQAAPPAASAPAPAADSATPPPPPGGPGPVTDAGGPPPPGGPDGPRGHRPPPPPPPSRAAHIHLGRGDTVLDLKCAEDEPMKTCADLALQLLDRLQAKP
jgi:hypothetical protein